MITKGRKILSLTLIFTLMMSIIPLNAIEVFAAGPNVYVDIERIYNEQKDLQSTILTLTGELDKSDIYLYITDKDKSGADRKQIIKDVNYNGAIYTKEIEGNITIDNITIIEKVGENTKHHTINEIPTMPELKNIYYDDTDGLNMKVDSYGYFDGVKNPSDYINPDYSFDIGGKTEDDLSTTDTSDTERTYSGFNNTGIFDVEYSFEGEYTNNDYDFDINIKDIYPKQLYVIDELDFTSVEMPNNAGPQQGLFEMYVDGLNYTKVSDINVYFLSNVSDKLTEENKGEIIDNRAEVDEATGTETGRRIVAGKTPSISPNEEYYMVITNSDTSERGFVKDKNDDYIKYLIIGGVDEANIRGLSNDKGYKGMPMSIEGEYLPTFNLQGFDVSGINSVTHTQNSITVEYSPSSGDIQKIQKTITIEIDKRQSEITDYIFPTIDESKSGEEISDDQVYDKIDIIVPDPGALEEDKNTELIFKGKTQITYTDNSVYTYTEIDSRDFTLKPIEIKAEIYNEEEDGEIGVNHDELFIIPTDDGQDFQLDEDTVVTIMGEKFMVYNFGDNITRYPIVKIGSNTFDFNKNKDDILDLYVLDEEGNRVDGTADNEEGNKIVMILKEGTLIETNMSEDENKSPVNIRVINYQRDSLNNTVASGSKDTLPDSQFSYINVKDNDELTLLRDDDFYFNTKGGEEVTIEGQFFTDKVKLMIGGKEIEDLEVIDEGTITFTTPPHPEGTTLLQIINEGKNIASKKVYYMPTFTSPTLEDFGPKKGDKDTLVVIKGSGFYRPDPGVSPNKIYSDKRDKYYLDRLIGTKVLLNDIDGEVSSDKGDKNIYNKSETTGKIELQKYNPDTPLIDIKPKELDKDGETKTLYILRLADYAESLVLENEDGKKNFYTIYKDKYNRIILEDDVETKYMIINSESNPTKMLARSLRTKKDYPLEYDSNNGALILEKSSSDIRTLSLKTLYQVKDGEIYGNKTKVKDSNTIHFKVPDMNVEKPYELVAKNFDGKYAKGNVNFIYKDSELDDKPSLEKNDNDRFLSVNKGPISGGSIVEVYGPDFYINHYTDEKTEVYINGNKIPEENIEINPKGEAKLNIEIPPYEYIDRMDTEGIKRVKVPIVIQNDNISSQELWFNYLDYNRLPKLSPLENNSGRTDGEEIRILQTSDLKFSEKIDTTQYIDGGKNLITDDINFDINGNGKLDSAEDKLNNLLLLDEEEKDIIPKIFFGDKEATLKTYDKNTGLLELIIPGNDAGDVEVYAKNYDGSISNTIDFTYVGEIPNIISMNPTEGMMKGNTKITIKASGIKEKEGAKIYNGDNILEALVRFGNNTNINIDIDEENSGKLTPETEVKVEIPINSDVDRVENLVAIYDKDRENITLELTKGTEKYSTTIEYSGEEIFIPIDELEDKNENSYQGFELIRLNVNKDDYINGRLIVERGYSPIVKLNEYKDIEGNIVQSLIVESPSYPINTTVDLNIINPMEDNKLGEKVTTDFKYTLNGWEVKVTDVTRDGDRTGELGQDNIRRITLPSAGGAELKIFGVNFLEEAKIYLTNDLGETVDITDDIVEKVLPNKDIEGGEGHFRLILRDLSKEIKSGVDYYIIVDDPSPHGQGSSSNTVPNPIALRFENILGLKPSITEITPDKGPSKGENEVVITGTNFKDKPNVLFDGEALPEEDVEFINSTELRVIAPFHIAGSVDVKVENPNELSSTLQNGYTYISNPIITGVLNEDENRINTISVEGNETVFIKGSGFKEGAKVVFVPKLKEAVDEENIIYIEDESYIIESGKEATNVEYIDSETLKVTTPEGELDTKGIIVINPDRGASEIYQNIKYIIPKFDAPTGVEADLMYDSYIKVSWNEVKGAEGYEIYVIIDDEDTQFVGTTEYTSFIYKDIEERTDYRFKVKALGDFGGSDLSKLSNEVDTGRDIDKEDSDNSINEKTEYKKDGNKALVSVGLDDYKEDITIDLTEGNLSGSEEVLISIPADVITSSRSGDIKVISKDYMISFSPYIFRTDIVERYDNRDDAGIRFTISKYKNNPNIKDKTRLSTQIVLSSEFFVGNKVIEKNKLNPYSTMKLQMIYDGNLARIRRLDKVSINRYNSYSSEYIMIKEEDLGFNSSIITNIKELGRYIILGRRR